MNKYIFALCFIIISIMLINSPKCVTEPTNLTITSPQEGILTNIPPDIVIDFGSTPPMYIIVTINNISEATYLFQISKEGASASGEDLKPYYVQGNNKISVEAFYKDGTATKANRNFLFDTSAPWIRFESLEGENNLVIKGIVEDVSGVKELKINDVKASLAGKYFQVEIPNDSYLRVYAIDEFDYKTEYTLARPKTILPSALGLKLDQGGFDYIAELITQEINAQGDLCTTLVGYPVSAGTYQDPSGMVVTYQVTITQASCGKTKVTMNANPASDTDAIFVNLIFSDVQVTLSVTGKVIQEGVEQPLNGTLIITADELKIVDKISLTIQDNLLVITSQEVSVTSVSMNISSEGLPESLVTYLSDTLYNSVEEMLGEVVKNVIEPAVEEVLSLLTYTGEMEGTIPILVSFSPQSFSARDGVMTLLMKGMIYSSIKNDKVQFFPGSFFTNNPSPELKNITPTIVDSSDISGTSSDDLFNQYLYFAYMSGALNQTISIPLPQGNPTLIWLLTIMGIPTAETLTLTFSNTMPPSMILGEDIGDNTFALYFQDVMVKGVFKDKNGNTLKDSKGNEINLTLLLSGIIPVKLTVTDHNTIIMVIDPSSIKLNIECMPTSTIVVPTSSIETLLNQLISLAIEELNSQIPEIPLPTIPGFEYQLLEINSNIFSQGGYVGMFANLGQEPTPQE